MLVVQLNCVFNKFPERPEEAIKPLVVPTPVSKQAKVPGNKVGNMSSAGVLNKGPKEAPKSSDGAKEDSWGGEDLDMVQLLMGLSASSPTPARHAVQVDTTSRKNKRCAPTLSCSIPGELS